MITCVFEDGGKGALRHVVVHAIVERDGKLLLVKRAPKLLEGGKWSLPSGFLDRDETAEQCALRELREETGWSGEIVSFFRINTNPNRPHEDRQNVAIEYIVKAIKKVGEGDWESTDIRWFPINELPSLDALAFDHGVSIGLYLDNRKQNQHIL
jgi:8-oxo-dGTP diphosphatase